MVSDPNGDNPSCLPLLNGFPGFPGLSVCLENPGSPRIFNGTKSRDYLPQIQENEVQNHYRPHRHVHTFSLGVFGLKIVFCFVTLH